MEHIVFGGVDLSDRFTCLVKSRPMPKMDADTEHVSGTDRYIPMGASILPEAVTFRLVLGSASMGERRALGRWLGGVLYSKVPQRLEFSSDDGLWCMAMLSKRPDLTELVKSGYVDVTMQPMDAAWYGDTHTATVPSGGSVSILTGGNYPTSPTITATSATKDASSGVWGVRLDEGDFLHVPLSSANPVSLDCENRVCLVNGNVVLPTLDSDWFTLGVGSHTIRNDQGSGACTVTWTDRWL